MAGSDGSDVEHLIDDLLALLEEHDVEVTPKKLKKIRAMRPQNVGKNYERDRERLVHRRDDQSHVRAQPACGGRQKSRRTRIRRGWRGELTADFR